MLIVWNNRLANGYASRLESFEVEINNLVGRDWLRWKRNWKLIVLPIHQFPYKYKERFLSENLLVHFAFHYACILNKANNKLVYHFGYFHLTYPFIFINRWKLFQDMTLHLLQVQLTRKTINQNTLSSHFWIPQLNWFHAKINIFVS